MLKAKLRITLMTGNGNGLVGGLPLYQPRFVTKGKGCHNAGNDS
jgi:hypothetical protein